MTKKQVPFKHLFLSKNKYLENFTYMVIYYYIATNQLNFHVMKAKQLLSFSIISLSCLLISSCSICHRTNDKSYYLSEQDKTIHYVKNEQQITFKKNNEEDIFFYYEPTELIQNNIRLGDDEGCYADYCEQSISKIKIDNTGTILQFNVENCINQGRYNVNIYNNNSGEYQTYNLIDSEKNIVPNINNYQTNSSTFLSYTQNFKYKDKNYSDVLVFKGGKTENNEYIIIKPNFELLYLEYKNNNYKNEN